MRAQRLSERLILSLVPDQTTTPKQYRFNHTDCPAGSDHRQRLYIKIPEDQPWTRVAYCHNCGLSGFTSLRKSSLEYKQAKRRSRVLRGEAGNRQDYFQVSNTLDTAIQKAKSRLTDLTRHNATLDSVPPEVRVHLNRRKVSRDIYQRYLLDYDSSLDRIIIPYFEYNTTNLLSVQFKSPLPQTVPKFFTESNPAFEYKTDVVSRQSIANTHHELNNTAPKLELVSPREKSTLVIVEDYFSAIRIAESDDTLHALPLAGVHYDTMQLAQIMQRELYKKVIVWLDNDSAVVIAKARSLVTDLQFICDDRVQVKIVSKDIDPKYVQPPKLLLTYLEESV